jgi:GTP-binding protein
VVGRPNVGKSTLVNRLAARRGAGSIVGAAPGLTRDRLDADVTWRGRGFVLADTGGVTESRRGAKTGEANEAITDKVARKAMEAAAGADLVLFVVDATTGVTSDELALAKRLRRLDKPLVVVANKVDAREGEASAAELWSLGLGEPVPVSAIHGRGSGDLLDAIVDLLPEAGQAQAGEAVPAIAIVGRPNVGKSSLFNRLVGEERAIVHPEPGTTRDSVDTIAEVDGKTYRFIDTAGMRRRAKTKGPDVMGRARTASAISAADLAVLVVDAAEGPTAQDQRIAEMVAGQGTGAVVALNKWDMMPDEETAKRTERDMADRLGFVSYAPTVRTSALTGRGLEKLAATLPPVLQARRLRVPTAELNRLIQEAQQKQPPPRIAGRNVRVLYATQASAAPPTFVLFATGELVDSWKRFIERRLREEFGFFGNPVQIVGRLRRREDRSSPRASHRLR